MSAHTNWESVYEALKKEASNTHIYYMITTNKGNDKEERTSFLPLDKAREVVLYEIEKQKILAGKGK